jgi:hypothetical protein
VLAVLGGPPLDPATGLGAQGVPDGALLTLATAVDHAVREARVEDDLASVVAAAVEEVPPPPSDVAWGAALVVAATLLALGGLAVVVDGTFVASLASGLTAAVLLGAVVLAGRAPRSPARAVAAWLAVGHAGAAGLVAGPVGAGAAWVVAGGVAALASRRRDSPVWAATIAGVVLVVAGGLATLLAAPFGVVAAVAMAGVVATGDLQPWLAATLAGLVPPPLGEDPPVPPDREVVGDAVRRAHGALLVAGVATALVLAVLGPVVAARGPWGVALALLCCAVVALRSRRHRVGTGGVAGLLAGLVPLAPVAFAVWLTEPGWRLVVVGAVVAVGLLVLAAVALPTPRSARVGRLAELVEALSLVALPPVTLAATGLLDLVRAVVG